MLTNVEIPVVGPLPENVAPIHEGTTRQGKVSRLTSELYDLDGSGYVKITYSDGREFRLPADLVGDLGSYGQSMVSDIAYTLEDRRKDFAGDLGALHGLKSIGDRPDGANGWVLPDVEDDQADGVPYLRWTSPTMARRIRGAAANPTHGWVLRLQGMEGVQVAFTPWNDRDGLLGLVEAMSDTDTLMIMAAMTYPEEVAKLSARMTAGRLRATRSLPGIDLKKVRTILTGAGLTNQRVEHSYYAGRLRVLNVQSGTKNVPVAVAVMAPSGDGAPLTEEEQQLPASDRRTLVYTRRSEASAVWVERAKVAMLAAGWRQVHLDPPGRTYSHAELTRWYTRFTPETWGLVEAAAKVAVKQVSMGRGGVI
jgi:hypothetical protein